MVIMTGVVCNKSPQFVSGSKKFGYRINKNNTELNRNKVDGSLTVTGSSASKTSYTSDSLAVDSENFRLQQFENQASIFNGSQNFIGSIHINITVLKTNISNSPTLLSKLILSSKEKLILGSIKINNDKTNTVGNNNPPKVTEVNGVMSQATAFQYSGSDAAGVNNSKHDAIATYSHTSKSITNVFRQYSINDTALLTGKKNHKSGIDNQVVTGEEANKSSGSNHVITDNLVTARLLTTSINTQIEFSDEADQANYDYDYEKPYVTIFLKYQLDKMLVKQGVVGYNFLECCKNAGYDNEAFINCCKVHLCIKCQEACDKVGL